MTVYRLDHVGVVVEDLAAAVAFFVELGLELEGEATVEGEWVDQVVGLDGVRADIAVVRTPDGHGRVELSTFHTPVATSPAPRAPVNTPGILASRSPSTPSTTSSTACAPTAPNSWARWRSTGTSTGTATSAAPTASSSGWSRTSAEPEHRHHRVTAAARWAATPAASGDPGTGHHQLLPGRPPLAPAVCGILDGCRTPSASAS